jgi:hypothetical protein
MKNNIIIIASFTVISFTQCSLILGSKQDNQNNNALAIIALSQTNREPNQTNKSQGCNKISKTNNIGTFTDCSDGTVSYEGAGFFAGKKLTYAKCPPGYTFSGGTCSGSIQFFKWCNDFPFNNSPNFSISCETNFILNSGPLFDTCDKFTLGGKKWRLPYPLELKRLIICKDGNSPISNPPVAFEQCANGNKISVPNVNAVDATHKDIFPNLYMNLQSNSASTATSTIYINFGNTQERPDGGKASNSATLCVSDE